MKHIKTRILYTLFFAFGLLLLGGGAAFAEEQAAPDNGIPVVYVTIDESQGTIDAMNESENHSVHCKGTIRIDVPDGFHYCDMPDAKCKSLEETGMDIRGRGNTTWWAEKKPYKIKLDSKENVLGLGKNKHWVLIANAYDKTLLKDRISGWLGDAIGMDFTPRGVPVDFVMQNTDGTFCKYLGSYYLSENVRVDTNRIEIDELDETITDPDSLEITGGYLIQGGVQKESNSPSVFYTKKDFCLANDTPSFDPADGDPVVDAQKNYIRNYIQEFEDALFSADYEGKNGSSYRDMMDMESAAKYWLVDALCKNGDGYGTGSTYFYKTRDTESDGVRTPGKLYWGPLWDFDYAWTYESDDEDAYKGFDTHTDWVPALLHDTGEGGFVKEVKAQWLTFRAAVSELTRDGGIIDQYYEETKDSQAQDYIVNSTNYDGEDSDSGSTFVYKDEVEALKSWIDNRAAWMHGHLGDLDTLISMITYESDGIVLDTMFVETGNSIPNLARTPEKDGYVFIGWNKEDSTPLDNEDVAQADMTLTARFIPEDEATHATNLYLRLNEDWIDIHNGEYDVAYTVVPQNVQDKNIVWKSSNEDIASFVSASVVRLHSTGDVTLTGTLKYNSSVKRTLKLHVVDTRPAKVTSLKFNKSVINMHKGKYAHVLTSFVPAGSSMDYLDYVSSNRKVATVDENGVIYGKGPGSATITATGYVFTDDEQIEVKAKCKVNVSLAKKKTNPIVVKGKTVSLKRSVLKKKSRTIKRSSAIKITKAKGKKTYKLASVSKSKKYFKVSKKTGKITVKKGLKKGTYKLKIKVRAAGDYSYKARTRTASVTIKVK